MYIIEINSFKKDYKRLDEYKRSKVKDALKIFRENPHHPQLKTHKLKGSKEELYSFSADYDLRVIFKYENNKIIVILISVGTHSQVY